MTRPTVTASRVPACMTVDEFAFWNRDPLVAADSPCVDCTVNWHLARLAEGRCNGTPGDDSERVYEHMSDETRRARNRARMARKRVHA